MTVDNRKTIDSESFFSRIMDGRTDDASKAQNDKERNTGDSISA